MGPKVPLDPPGRTCALCASADAKVYMGEASSGRGGVCERCSARWSSGLKVRGRVSEFEKSASTWWLLTVGLGSARVGSRWGESHLGGGGHRRFVRSPTAGGHVYIMPGLSLSNARTCSISTLTIICKQYKDRQSSSCDLCKG